MTNIQEKLIEYGFGEYEARAYCALISRSQLSAGEISKITEIPQGRVYSILNGLLDKGFVNVFAGAIKKYEAVNPETAFKSLIESKRQDVKQLQDLSTSLSETFEKQKVESTKLDFVQILTSKKSQVDKFDDLIHSSKQTLYSFNKKPYATGFNRSKEQIDLESTPLKQVIASGTEVKAIFERETGNVENFKYMLHYYHSIGEQVRIAEELPLKMLLVDSQLAMVSLRSGDSSRFQLTSMVVDHTDLTSALAELFEHRWNNAMSLTEYLSKY